MTCSCPTQIWIRCELSLILPLLGGMTILHRHYVPAGTDLFGHFKCKAPFTRPLTFSMDSFEDIAKDFLNKVKLVGYM